MVYKIAPQGSISRGLLIKINKFSLWKSCRKRAKLKTKFLAARQFVNPTRAPWLSAVFRTGKYNTSSIYIVKKCKCNAIWSPILLTGDMNQHAPIRKDCVHWPDRLCMKWTWLPPSQLFNFGISPSPWKVTPYTILSIRDLRNDFSWNSYARHSYILEKGGWV